MRVSRQGTILPLFLLLTLSLTVITVRADDDEPEEYDVKARVVRLSFIEGQVNLKRSGGNDWESARLNYPLVEGDTVVTEKDSRLEIQVDSQNFIRLSANSVVRIITLRDEGIAISVVDGTVTVRLAKFDRGRGYFELDAPRTTMTAERDGLYRVDVGKDGRVRLSVRDGGSARIYSDTAGFTLHDGRMAELVFAGANAGFWDLSTVAPDDAIDEWVKEREQYLAKRSREDVKYYDEYVWGAEDLDSYGDWVSTRDYGWIWRPHASSLSAYADWAPYRYGNWTWCPPYGWTWVGYEPWGWAPYHYGRWVYYNNYWAWVPRSRYQRNRSWWRPALVAFVSLDFSYGNNICWYPLNYYQRDPGSRQYRNRGRNPNYGGPGGGQHDRRNDYPWRGVTRVPRRDFGDPNRRGEPVDDERVARRVVESEPQTDLPRRGGGYRTPFVPVPERPTGAAERVPGVPLDDDLRRSRFFRGRNPRLAEPSETTNTNPGPGTRPTGAVARPEPENRPERRNRPDSERRSEQETRPIVRPAMPGMERPGENPERIDNTPRRYPERRNEPRPEPPAEPRTEPRSEPRPEPSAEPRPERRSEPRAEPRTEPRSEPRSQPRSEPRESPPAPRSEPPPRSQPPSRPDPPSRSEPPPRSDPPPRSEPAPRSDPPPRVETPRPEVRPESPRPKPDDPMF